MLLNAIEPQSRKKLWLVVGFGIFALSLPTLWADMSAEIALLNAAKAHFEDDIKPSEEKLFRNIANGSTTNFRTDSTDADYSLNAENSPANAAKIGGDLNCDSGNFVSEGGASALETYDANIQGAVLLVNGFRAKETVSLKRAKIAGDLKCDSGNFVGEGGASALDASNTEVGGELTLANGFTAEGLVDLSNSHVVREFVLDDVRTPDHLTINLQFAKVGTLSNSKHSWPKKGNLSLLGFVYDQIDPNARPDARIQIQWIHRQRDEFFAQPYNQLATALRRMGRDEEANVALVAKNRDDGRHRKEPWDAIWYKGLGKLIGFGYRPWNALFVSFGVIAIGTVLFGIGFRKEIVTPTTDAAFGVIRGSQHQLLESYPRFNAFIYSLETFVPIVKFEVAQYWIPNANRGVDISLGRFALMKTGGLLRAYLWLHITLGWILTTIWVGGFTGLLKT